MPCCIIALLLLFGPRLVLLGIWIFNNAYMGAAVNAFLWQCLGFIFLPWTLLAYIFAWHTVPGAAFMGLDSAGVLIVVVGLALDIFAYAGGGFGNRKRLPGYSS